MVGDIKEVAEKAKKMAEEVSKSIEAFFWKEINKLNTITSHSICGRLRQ